MYKALVIGCGNIGALYDLDVENIWTHAKALHLDSRFSLAVYDINKSLVKQVARKYNCEIVERIDKNVLELFDCVSICTPTSSHYEILRAALNARVKLIICEKPVSNNVKELNGLKRIYSKGSSKVLVNYIRRFQPPYEELRNAVSNILKKEILTNICVRYQRGFSNNCGHAFDTIEYLTNHKLILKRIKIHNKSADHFKDDLTLSLQANWDKTNVIVAGLSDVQFPYFEIDLYFNYHLIAIKNGGANIEIYEARKNGKSFQPLKIRDQVGHENCLKDYMKFVINHAHDLLSAEMTSDNFSNSVDLNLRMLKYMNN